MIRYYILLLAVISSSISCETIKSNSNFVTNQNTEFDIGNEVAYLGTIKHSPAVIKLIGSNEEWNEWFTTIDEDDKQVFDLAKKSFAYGNINLTDFSAELTNNISLADEFLDDIDLYQSQKNFESLPEFPQSLTDNGIKPEQRYGIINIFSTAKVQSNGPGVGFGMVTISVNKTLIEMNFTSLLLDFETQQVVSYYNFTDEYYLSSDSFEILFESLLLAYNNNRYVRPKILEDLKDYKKYVRVTMADGGLFFCKVKYLSDFKMQVDLNGSVTVYDLDEFTSIIENHSDYSLIPSE